MRAALLVFLMVFAPAATASAQDQAPSDEQLADEFVINNSTFVLYHEIGHLFIGEFSIPILGKEEDAADNLAALLLLSAETVEADNALIDSADGWFLSDAASASESETYEDAEFYDVHSLDVQRAYQVVCLMVGANAEVFGEVAASSGLDEERQESCALDFEQAATSWNKVLEPFAGDGQHHTDIAVSYEPSENHSGAAELLQNAQLLESSAEYILRGYALPRPVAMRATECGEPNAFYDPEVGEVVFCYELADHFYDMFMNAFGGEQQ